MLKKLGEVQKKMGDGQSQSVPSLTMKYGGAFGGLAVAWVGCGFCGLQLTKDPGGQVQDWPCKARAEIHAYLGMQAASDTNLVDGVWHPLLQTGNTTED